MPVTQSALTANMLWSLSTTNTGFGATTEGPDSNNYSATPSVSTFNQLFAAQYTIAGSGSQTINLESLTNLVNETFSFGHVLILMIQVSGSDVVLSPGGSNANNLNFGGTSPTWTIHNGGMFCFSENQTGTGIAVGTTTKNILLSNTTSTSCVVKISILGSTS